MMTIHDAYNIGQDWIEKWNENNLANYSSLYEDDAEEVSSLASRLVQISNGRLKGKTTLFIYWELIRHLFPDYKYEMKKVTLYNNDIIIFFTMKAFESNCIAKLSVNQQHKIERTIICHV